MENKSQKGLPLETKNTQNHENRRLGLIESLSIGWENGPERGKRQFRLPLKYLYFK